jgi:hypothetical protein
MKRHGIEGLLVAFGVFVLADDPFNTSSTGSDTSPSFHGISATINHFDFEGSSSSSSSSNFDLITPWISFSSCRRCRRLVIMIFFIFSSRRSLRHLFVFAVILLFHPLLILTSTVVSDSIVHERLGLLL